MQTLHRTAALCAALAAAAWSGGAVSAPATTAGAAQALLRALDEPQRDAARFAFDDPERRDWHYVPRERRGVRLDALAPAAREAAEALLRSALSARGVLEVHGVLLLEGILRELESRPGRPAAHRDPGAYRLSVFGAPGAGAGWGWRLEGHHLSLNWTERADGEVAATPLFVGSNPGVVASGPQAGLELLAAERELAFALLESLDAEQLARARVAERAPADVVLSPGNDQAPAPAGIPASALDAAQRARLEELAAAFTGRLRGDLDHAARARLRAVDPAELRFAWAGALERRGRWAWRIAGPGFAFEAAAVQDDGDHVHALWRELGRDFGGPAR